MLKKLLILIVISVLVFSCKDDDPVSSVNSGDSALYGSWEMAKITSSVLGQTIVIIPEDVGISNVTTFKQDLTMNSITDDGEEVTTDKGTWFTLEGIITIDIDGDDPVSGPYSVNGDTVTIEGELEVPDYGNVKAKIEYKKQN